MIDFKILVCEDEDNAVNLIDAYIKSLNQQYKDLNIEKVDATFDNVIDLLSTKLYALLILDMYEGLFGRVA